MSIRLKADELRSFDVFFLKVKAVVFDGCGVFISLLFPMKKIVMMVLFFFCHQ